MRGRRLVSSERGTEARRRRPASGGGGSSPVTGEQGRGFLARVRWRRRDHTRCECWGLGRRETQGDIVFVGLGCIPGTDTYPQAYSRIAKLIKNRILRRYVSGAYPTRIRIGYVSDTRYAPSATYPCNVA